MNDGYGKEEWGQHNAMNRQPGGRSTVYVSNVPVYSAYPPSQYVVYGTYPQTQWLPTAPSMQHPMNGSGVSQVPRNGFNSGQIKVLSPQPQGNIIYIKVFHIIINLF